MEQVSEAKAMKFHTTWCYAQVLFLISKSFLLFSYTFLTSASNKLISVFLSCFWRVSKFDWVNFLILFQFWVLLYFFSFFFFISTQLPGEWTIYPWIHTNCNSLSDDDQLRPISIPDIHPARYALSNNSRTGLWFLECVGSFRYKGSSVFFCET